MSEKHTVTRVRHEVRRRLATVKAVQRLTPNMVRVTLTGDALEGFVSQGYDDHVKLIFPRNGGIRSTDLPPSPDDLQRPLMRDFTPRRFDADARELIIDFALHEAGPAAEWAAQAREGQYLEIGGPRSSFIVSDDFDGYLFVGDETALPAIGRRLEELRADTRAIVVAAVAGRADEQTFRSAARVGAHWVHRPTAQAADPRFLLDALAGVQLPDGEVYAWVAAESGVAKTVRQHLLVERGLDRARVKAAGYWRVGGAGVHDSFDD